MSVSLESLMPDPALEDDGRSVGDELLAFVIVGTAGAAAFVVLSSLVIGGVHGVPSWLVSACCYAALILPVYLLHRRFTFPTMAPHRQALPRYAGVQLCALTLAALFSYVSYHVIALPTVGAALLVACLTSGVSFMVLKFWAFAVPQARAMLEPKAPLASVPPSRSRHNYRADERENVT